MKVILDTSVWSIDLRKIDDINNKHVRELEEPIKTSLISKQLFQ
jgi:hypothetical protein